MISWIRALASVALVAALSAPAAVEATTATYHDYGSVKPEQTFCNIQFKSPALITAYANLGSDLKCGDCVEVTNTRTKAKVVVKVVDKGGNVFDLSIRAFNAIDTDKNGYARGHMDITYRKVKCSRRLEENVVPGFRGADEEAAN
ncbi:hypothetical protein Poli38472_014456 [Pythium oligandrum]|uniref:Barwin domain-containing protein n=2 Tax=Pythiaceae TaxID=4782 RepID=A0A8K1CDW8_PYTOL|nr:hypothetical protein Poli38472_014456 [Pythium oligandrum]DBA02581.1 TPA: hypothetical protein N0F65_011953 [Lagenidium giganteum]|eukprot:TMW60995.1 hypothetical protein Poli38472_014456 [Pythium oligandrum]